MTRLLGVTLLLATAAAAQPGPPPGRGGQLPPEAVRPVLYDTVIIPDSGGPTVRVDLLYRIAEEFFVPVKDPDPASQSPFRRRGELLSELRDSTGTTRGRVIRSLERAAAHEERLPSGTAWMEGTESLRVPPGAYTILMEVTDRESDRRFTDRTRRLVVPTHAEPGPQVVARFLTAGEADPAALVPQNFGTDVRFGSRGGLVLLLRGITAETPDPLFTYSLRQVPEHSPGADSASRPDTARSAIFLKGVTLHAGAPTEGPVYGVSHAGAAPDGALFMIPLAMESLRRRPYRLRGTLAVGDSGLSVDVVFRPVWPDMPLSLRDPEYALDALRHITTPAQLDSLKQGSPEARRRALEEFWLPRDPTPGTAVNEVMTEYYRRVDRALTEFSTLREADGARTDRGRVYVLHGPPTARDRVLGGTEGNREIWTYEGLGKRFIFLDELRNGSYTLIATQGL